MAAGVMQYDARSPGRSMGSSVFEFVTNNTSSPDAANNVDWGDVVASVVRAGVGVHTVTLDKRWRRVKAFAVAEDATATVIAKVTATVAGPSAANTITVQTESSGAAADTTSKRVVVMILLQN